MARKTITPEHTKYSGLDYGIIETTVYTDTTLVEDRLVFYGWCRPWQGPPRNTYAAARYDLIEAISSGKCHVFMAKEDFPPDWLW